MRRQLMRLALENAFISPNQPSHDDALIMGFRKEFGHLYPTPPVVIEHNPIGRPYLAMEEIANGQPVNEIEHTIYARVVDPTDLEQAASKENQEQWEIRIEKAEGNAGKGSMRVRKTWAEGQEAEATYVRTSKVVMNDKGDKIELPLPSNKDEFTVFKFLAVQGMRKVRFTFPIIGTDLKWEIDMFPKADGDGYHEWCKIDLEVTNRDQPIPEFPIPLEDVILPEGYGRASDPKVEQQVKGLYDQFFLMKNEFLAPKSTTPAAPDSANDQGIATMTPALPNDVAEPVMSNSSASDEAPEVAPVATPAAQSTTATPDEQLSKALDEPTPESLTPPAKPEGIQTPSTAQEPSVAPVPEADVNGQHNPPAESPNGANPVQDESTTPEQRPDALADDNGQATPDSPDSPDVTPPDLSTPDNMATGAGASDAEPEVAEQTEDDAEAKQAEADQVQTQAKVDQIQTTKKAEATSLGEQDPTEDGKVPVDLIDNPKGDPSVPQNQAPDEAELEDGAGTGGNTTGAADGSAPDENAEGTGDGLGGDLGDTGSTGTVSPDDLNSQDATDPALDEGEEPISDTGNGTNGGEGTDLAEVNGEEQETAAGPEKAPVDEIPVENQRRPEEAEQAVKK